MEIGEVLDSSKDLWIQQCEVVVREIQIKQVVHSLEGAAFDFTDSAGFQVKRNHLNGAWEAESWDVVEVVSTEIEELRLCWEASGNFGVTLGFTCGMMCFSLQEKRNIFVTCLHCKEIILKLKYLHHIHI